MKRIFIYLTLLFISQITWSQESAPRIDSIITYSYSSSTDSVLDSKTVSSYDSYGSLTLEYYYNWDLDLSAWVEVVKCEFAYNSSGDLIMDFLYRWDSSIALWIEYSKREYAYNSDGTMLLETYFKWDSGLSDWLVSFKSEYAYDGSGRQTLNAGYTWDFNLNDWAPLSKFEVSYGSDGNSTLSVYYVWNSNLNDWVGFFKNEDGHDSHGNKTSRIVSYWNLNASDWMVSDKLEYVYDSNGNRLSEIYYSWDSNQNDWLLSCKKELIYDSRGNNTLATSYIWDSGINDWIVIYKSSYYYDSRYYIESASICSNDRILWQGEFYNTEGIYYARYIAETGSDSIHVLRLTVYPNPSSFDISGHNIVQENQLVVYSAPVNRIVVYSWLAENGNVISNPSDNSVEIEWGGEGKGTVYGIGMDQYGCMSDTSRLQVIIGSADNNNSLHTDIKIYPNPAKDYFFIDASDYIKTEGYRLVIINQLGNRVFEALVEAPVYEANCSSWAVPGLYYVQILDLNGGIIDIKKIVLQ